MALKNVLILRKQLSGCLEGRTVSIQPIRISCPASKRGPVRQCDELDETSDDTRYRCAPCPEPFTGDDQN
jgi:hypothetical protein